MEATGVVVDSTDMACFFGSVWDGDGVSIAFARFLDSGVFVGVTRVLCGLLLATSLVFSLKNFRQE